MSSRPRPPPPSPSDPDLDSTAELPVLDPPSAPDPGATLAVKVAPGAGSEPHFTDTDTWAGPPSARPAHTTGPSADDRRKQDAERQQLATALADAQERLASHSKRQVQLERARDEALAAQAAAAQRAAAAEQRAGHADQRSATFEKRVAELERQAAKASAELAERETVRAQQAQRVEESARARTAAEQQATARAAELVQARALVSAAGARAQELQRALDQHAGDARARQRQELEQQQVQAVERRVHAAGVMQDLHQERSRAMSYLESLQTLERRRELAQELVTDLQREAEARGAELARLNTDMAAGAERAQAQERELTQRAARLAQLEEQAGTLTTMLAQRDSELRDAQQAAAGLRTSVARLQGEINAGTERLRALEAQAVQRAQGDSEQQTELQRLRTQAAGVASALEEARRSAESAAAQASSQQAALAQQRERALQLEASLEAERHRSRQLETELATVRAEMEEWGGVLRSAQQERAAHLAGVAAAEARVRELERDAATRAENVRTLQTESSAHLARIRELEGELHAAGESLQKSTQQWRETAAVARPAATDTHPALGDSGRHPREDALAAEPVADGTTRLLVRSEEGREVVHVLGRKTSIGRTPDNDLQLDAKFISRHHAVILAGPVNTVIEDLNSTNGVQVNGRRIARQTLRDGDQIIIGRAHYRFAVRKAADKR